MSKATRHQPEPKPKYDWRRVHHSPLFWVGAFLFLAAITIYVLSDDLSWRPPHAVTTGEAEHSSKLVGNWQGNAPGGSKTISFGSDGRFVSLVRPGGLISMTLGQAVASTVRGTWAINGRYLALKIGGAEPELDFPHFWAAGQAPEPSSPADHFKGEGWATGRGTWAVVDL